MTDRPGRKALFTGALPGASPAADPSKEIAAHVPQLNDEIAAALSAAVAGNVTGPLTRHGSARNIPLSSRLSNATLDSLKQALVSSCHPARRSRQLSLPKRPGNMRRPSPISGPAWIRQQRQPQRSLSLQPLLRVSPPQRPRNMRRPLPDSRARLDQAVAAAREPAVAAGARTETVHMTGTIGEVEHRLELMVEKNPVPMLLTTPSFLITEANEAYAVMSGINPENLTNTSLTKFHVISQKGEGAKVALHEKRRSFGEVTVELPSGIHILEQYCIPVTDNGTVSSLMFVYNDVTAQKKKNDEIVNSSVPL